MLRRSAKVGRRLFGRVKLLIGGTGLNNKSHIRMHYPVTALITQKLKRPYLNRRRIILITGG